MRNLMEQSIKGIRLLAELFLSPLVLLIVQNLFLHRFWHLRFQAGFALLKPVFDFVSQEGESHHLVAVLAAAALTGHDDARWPMG